MTAGTTLLVAMGYSFFFFDEMRPGTDVEAICEEIAQGFRNEPHLLPVSAGELAQSLTEGLAVVVILGEKPVGYARLIHLTYPSSGDVWYELGSTWVPLEHRRHRLAWHMYERILARHGGKNILLTTTNKFLLKMCLKLKFAPVFRKSLPGSVWQASCTCSPKKTGTEDNSACQLADGEPQLCKSPCWFMLAPGTAERHGVTVA